MIDPLRIVVLATLAIFAVSSFPTAASAAKSVPRTCADNVDCQSHNCKISKGEKTGVCVSAKRVKKKSY
jgi:hypothetical protein